MTWNDFDFDTELERDLLRRALPLVPTNNEGRWRATIDPASKGIHVEVAANETIGPTAANCIELLEIRPLLVGAAWKVLDLLVEAALEEAGTQLGRRPTITKKVRLAKAGAGCPPSLGATAWGALTTTYAELEAVRHSLVHRRAHTDSVNALVGVDDTGKPLRPLSAREQEAFVRAVLRAAELVLAPSADERAESDLLGHLSNLAGLHGLPLGPTTELEPIPEITIILDAQPGNDFYLFDAQEIRAMEQFHGLERADLRLQFRGRPGQDRYARLEDAPAGTLTIDADSPPAWLH